MDSLEEYKTAIPLAGTVMFPFPYPASARITIVSPPSGLGLGGDYIKIVHIVNEKQFTTWLAPLAALRAAKISSDAPTDAGPFAGWVLRAGDDLQTDIANARVRAGGTGSAEPLLYSRAIAYIAKDAPVITRCEIVSTAEEAADEYYGFICPVCPPPPPPHCH